MTNELEQIMKRRLEKSSESNNDDASNTPAFLSPRTSTLKKKKAFAIHTTASNEGNDSVNSNSKGNSIIPSNPSDSKDRNNDDETVTTSATNTSSLNDLNRSNHYNDNNNNDNMKKNQR